MADEDMTLGHKRPHEGEPDGRNVKQRTEPGYTYTIYSCGRKLSNMSVLTSPTIDSIEELRERLLDDLAKYIHVSGYDTAYYEDFEDKCGVGEDIPVEDATGRSQREFMLKFFFDDLHDDNLGEWQEPWFKQRLDTKGHVYLYATRDDNLDDYYHMKWPPNVKLAGHQLRIECKRT